MAPIPSHQFSDVLPVSSVQVYTSHSTANTTNNLYSWLGSGAAEQQASSLSTENAFLGGLWLLDTAELLLNLRILLWSLFAAPGCWRGLPGCVPPPAPRRGPGRRAESAQLRRENQRGGDPACCQGEGKGGYPVTVTKPSHFQPRTGDGHLWSYTNPNDKMVSIYLSINLFNNYLFCVY